MAITFEQVLNTTNGMTKAESALSYNFALTRNIVMCGKKVSEIYVPTYQCKYFGMEFRGAGGSNEILAEARIFGDPYNNIVVNNIYTQEGVLNNGISFFKLRSDGRNSYGSNSNYSFEIFIFGNGDIFLNTITKPLNTEPHKLIAGDKSYNFDKYASGSNQILYCIDDSGVYCNLSSGITTYSPASGLEITTQPSKNVFYKGDTNKFEGMVVSLKTDAGQAYSLSSSKYTIEYTDEIGMQTVSVNLGKYSTSLEIEIVADKIVSIDTFSLYSHYAIGMEMNEISVKAKWGSGKTEFFHSGYEISGYDNTTAGNQTVTVTYAGVSYSQDIIVAESVVLSISESAKTKYVVGIDTFEPYKMEATLEFSDGYSESIYYGDIKFDGFSNETIGAITMTAEYRSIIVEFEVEITDTATEYIGADNPADIIATLNITTGEFIITGTGATRVFTDDYIRGECLFYDYKTYAKEIKIEEGITEIYGLFLDCVNVEKASLPSTLKIIGSAYTGNGCFSNCVKLSEVNIPEALEYIGGFDGCTSLKQISLGESVEQIGQYAFTRDSELEITIKNRYCWIEDSYALYGVKSISGYTGSTAEACAYDNGITFHPLDVVTAIEITRLPKTDYFVLAKELNTTGLTVIGIVEDGSRVVLNNANVKVGECDFSSAGTKTVQVTYEEFETSFEVTVRNPTYEEISGNENEMYPAEEISLPWFMFDGAKIDSISVSKHRSVTINGKKVIGICDKAGNDSSTYLMLETILDTGIRVCKWRLKSGGGAYACAFELFFLQTNDIYINVTTMPFANASYGNVTSEIISNGKTYDLGFKSETPAKRACYHKDSNGLDWNIKNEEYVFTNTPSRIEIISRPDKTDYFIGEDLDTTGMVVSAVYTDGTSEYVSDFTVEYDFSEIGIKDVKVIDPASGISAFFQVYINKRFNIGNPIETDVVATTDIRNRTLNLNGVGSTKDDKFDTHSLSGISSYIDTLVIGEEVTRIGDFLFSGFDLKQVNGLEHLKAIGAYAFYINELSGVINLDKIEEIGSHAFNNCAVTKYVIGSSIRTIGSNAFSRNTQLKEIIIDRFADSVSGAPWGADGADVVWREKTKHIRVAHYPNKVYYKTEEEFNPDGLKIMAVYESGKENQITDYEIEGFDSTTVGRKDILISYFEDWSEDERKSFMTNFSVKVTAMGDNPYDGRPISVNVKVHWPNGEFADLSNDDLKSNALTLNEAICNSEYFIFGGCICNRIAFTTDSEQFMQEGTYPHGDIVVTVENAGTETKLFTGTIVTGERTDKLTEREIVACDYLYKFQNTDISWWYRNQTVDKKPQMLITQKQFRDALFDYLGIEQVPAVLEYDNALVPDTNIPKELNLLSVLRDLCLQNSVFGWMNRDGKFEYLKLPENARLDREDLDGTLHYEYYESELYFDSTNYDTCQFTEGRIWYPKEFLTTPYPGVFHPGDLTAQEAYEQNVYYNRDSFFVGDADWLDSAFQGDEYGIYTRMEPIMPICFGTTTKWDNQHIYMAQGYKMKIPRGNPLNKVGDTLEITVHKTASDGTELTWVVHSYIMSRTLKILGRESMSDEYTAKNAPYNGNNSQIGRKTQELSEKTFTMRSEAPTISYAEFTDNPFEPAALAENPEVKKAPLRCLKRCKKSDYDAMTTAGTTRPDTLYLTYEE